MREKCVCHEREEKPKRGTIGKSKQEEKKLLLLMAYIERSLSEDRTSNETIQVFVFCVAAYFSKGMC